MFHLLSYRPIFLFLSVPLLNSCTTSGEVVWRQGKVRINNDDEQRSLRGSRGEPECDGNNTQCYMISKDRDCKCKAVGEEKYYNEFMDDGGGRRGDREPACNNTCEQVNAEPYCDLEEGECLLLLNGGEDFTKEIEIEVASQESTSMISGCETTNDCFMISYDHYCECKAADEKKYTEYMDELMKDGPEDPKPGCDKTCEQLEAEPYCDTEEGKCVLSLDNGTKLKRSVELDPEKMTTTTLTETKKCREDEDCIVAVDRCEGCNCIAVHHKNEEEALKCEGTLMICPEEPCWTGENHMTASCNDGECYLNV